MHRKRLAGLALLASIVVTGLACQQKQENGQECLKGDDCLSGRCVQYVCVDPNGSKATLTDSGTTTPADTGTAMPETSSDTGAAMDTGGADSAPGDTGEASDAASD